jgi:hypothetical membrane protein
MTTFWRKTVFDFVLWGCGLFILLTVLAMFLYPGGTFSDPASPGYSFFENFFSDLGMSVSHAGQANTSSRAIFTLALAMVGLGLIFFFLAFPQFFAAEKTTQILSKLGSGFGILSGISFIGVAFTPHNLYLDAHTEFVLWAFRLFPLAVLCYTFVMRRSNYDRRAVLVFGIFFGLLVAYLLLLEFGPSLTTYAGMLIQATGQKIIVYASITSIMLQALIARSRC